MGHHVIEFDQQCGVCGGTGVYVGYAERDGAAVVCQECKGTGRHHYRHEYDDFEGRVRRAGVEHVVRVDPGVGIDRGRNGERQFSDFGGMDYESWFAGNPFPAKSEMRRFTCPAWWYQSADYKKKPNWDECGGVFPGCKYFEAKGTCWARWDAEFADVAEATA